MPRLCVKHRIFRKRRNGFQIRILSWQHHVFAQKLSVHLHPIWHIIQHDINRGIDIRMLSQTDLWIQE
ncbi:Uncharacterised protein [Vibrio cholerae]|nr:Uncharacterised protein [Vibrio cholerae]